MNTIGYDFMDPFLDLGELRIAIRLSTDSNIYCPSPHAVTVTASGGRSVLRASRLFAAGGQMQSEGSLELDVRHENGRYIISGKGAHPAEKCLSLVILIKGLPLQAFVSESSNMGKHLFQERSGIETIHYPGREATMPLVFVETGNEDWFILSKDDKVRQKSFAAYYDPSDRERVAVFAHREDRRRWSNEMELPEWHVGKAAARGQIVAERCLDLETHFGHVPFAQDETVKWVDDIRLVVNFHGEHWTGHVFNTFDQMTEQLRWLSRRIEGRHLLAFLPAWDGRYYCTYPVHQPSERMGGEEGLQRFVEAAHAFGVKVIPMLGGPNLATFAFMEKNGLVDASLKTESGFPIIQDWVDWNSDLTKEHMGYIVNFGHPLFQRYMVDRAADLIEKYHFDGLFLDGAIRWSNAPDYSPYEGIVAWAQTVRDRYPDKLLMAEDGYDVLWNHFRLFATSWGPLGLDHTMLRYTRQTEYLAYAAENGSSGVHEVGYRWRNLDKAFKDKTIPTIALFHDTIDLFGKELEQQIERYKAWRLTPASRQQEGKA